MRKIIISLATLAAAVFSPDLAHAQFGNWEIDLDFHEIEGHTIDRHVGKSVAELKNRALTNVLPCTSTYFTKGHAEGVMEDRLNESDSFNALYGGRLPWRQQLALLQPGSVITHDDLNPNYNLRPGFDIFGFTHGVYSRSADAFYGGNSNVIVFKGSFSSANNGWYILTGYPSLRGTYNHLCQR